MRDLQIGRAVREDADRLMQLAPRIAARYCGLELAAARVKIRADFAEGILRVDEHICRFAWLDFQQFEFSLHLGLTRDRLALSVHSRGPYQGFMLQTTDGARWKASVSNGLTYLAAEDAAALLAIVENLYDVRDMDLMQAALVRRAVA
jgi:hypothetical protein